jgi:hypothetical protein
MMYACMPNVIQYVFFVITPNGSYIVRFLYGLCIGGVFPLVSLC